MDFKNNVSTHAIIRRPCPHCCHLCSSVANSCPKCGEPLTPLKETSDKDVNYELIEEKSSEVHYIRLIEKKINRKIPRVEELKRNVLGYSMEFDKIIGLSLFKCNLQLFPRDILNLRSLKKLYLRRNNISEILVRIDLLELLEIIDLSINELIHLPKSIGLLSNLKVLVLSSNKLFNVPESLDNLSALKKLYLNNNKLKSIPESIGNLFHLKVLNLKANYWITISPSIKRLEHRGLQLIT